MVDCSFGTFSGRWVAGTCSCIPVMKKIVKACTTVTLLAAYMTDSALIYFYHKQRVTVC